MAKIPQGILGGLSGKIGGVVGSSWKGINVLKTKPLSVANPKTAGQIAQRTKFSNAVAFAGVILATVIKPLWDRFASKMSGYNEFIKVNLDLFAAEMPDPLADLVISKGKMAKTEMLTAVADVSDSNVTLTWDDDSGAGFKLATDVGYVVVVNVTKEIVEGFSEVETRVDGSTAVTIAHTFAEIDVMHVYLAFKRADGTIVSNTSNKVVTVQA